MVRRARRASSGTGRLAALLPFLRPKPSAAPAFPALPFTAVEKVLTLFAIGLAGAPVPLKAARPNDPSPFTDSATIYLPPALAEFPDLESDFRLYKLMVAHQWAQISGGTFEAPNSFVTLADPVLAIELYHLVESVRIETSLCRQFRGMAADFALAKADAAAKRPPLNGLPPRALATEGLIRWSLAGAWPADLPRKIGDVLTDAALVLEEMLAGNATATDSVRVATYLFHRIERLGGRFHPLPPVHFRGVLRLELAASVLEERRRREAPIVRPPDVVVEYVSQNGQVLKTRMTDELDAAPSKVVIRDQPANDTVVGQEGEEATIWLDLAPKRFATEVALSEAEREGAAVYDEWDYQRSAYKPRWCALRERVVAPGPPEYVDGVLHKHRQLIATIKRQFDALRPEYRRLPRQPDGEEIDLDSVVEAYADLSAGVTPSEALYIARHANRRDIAVAFLVDLSGSAGGWVNQQRIVDIERESLVLICEALQLLNDRYAIYGFSSSTRKQCDFFIIKDFHEPYTNDVRLRIGGMNPYSYTRMGPPIRHLARKLDQLDARVKLLILLSDGKPNDFDGYTGRYAIEDTRQALVEARLRGIRTFCLTIDSRAREYLPQMFGETGYTILDHVERLPHRLPELYRRLTAR
ncbi:MAG: VWA domain-containing protein [Dehalococcoidia bacterium]|nr:VWA domain-containing protein [Dehalococcoidia bacterium]